MHDRPIDRAAHLVDVHGLVRVHALRPRLLVKLDCGAVAHALLEVVPKLLVHRLIERAGAHLLVVEATIEDGRKRNVHMVAGGRAVLQHLVLVNVSAHHVVDTELLRQVPVRQAKEPILIALAHIVGKRHNNVSHNDRILARGALPSRLLGFVHALDAALHRAPVRLAIARLHAPHNELAVLVGVVTDNQVVLDALGVDVVALQAAAVAPIVGEHVPDRWSLVLRYVCHVRTALRQILAD